MEDSNAMTINFLRARLLSERAVSRAARQRADELAQRVAALEEQLRIVSTQRKKAEKATADVLAILETHGISDTSEEYYLSSDNAETHRELTKANGYEKSRESSVSSKQVANEPEDIISYPEVDSSIVFGRSLSWKGRQDSSPSLDKYKEASIRRHSGLASIAKPSKHCSGKSCRQIRQRDQRLEASEGITINSSQQPDHRNDEVGSDETCLNSAGNGPDMLNECVEFHKEKAQPQDPDSSLLEDEINTVNVECECNECGEETSMELALEHQEQLVCQYEAMEKAQREWEEKFREISCATLESCDPGNHSDVTEEAEEKPQVPQAPPAVTVPSAEAKLEVRDASITKTSPRTQHEHSIPTLQAGHGHLLGPSNEEFPSKVMDVPDQLDTSHLPNAVGMNQSMDFRTQQPLGTPFTSHDSPHVDAPVNQVVRHAHLTVNSLVPHGTAGNLAGVLNSLKQAKLMLNKQITSVPDLVNRPLGTMMEPCLGKPEPGNKVDIPGGFSGLFRLPSDISPIPYAKGDMPGSGTQLSPAYFYPSRQPSTSTGDPSFGNHYVGSKPSFPKDDQLVSRQFFNAAGPRTTIPSLGTNPYLDRSMRAYSSRHPYSDVMISRTLPYEGGIPEPHPSSGLAPQGSRLDHFTYYDGYAARPGVYKR